MSAMATRSRKSLLETSAIIVGYAMSRLDRAYLDARHLKSWKEAFAQAWKDRDMRTSRKRVMGELCEISDAALLEMIDGILRHDAEAVQQIVSPLSRPTERFHNIAERLRTGRLAEIFFRENCQKIAGVRANTLLDHRELFRGYDFGVHGRPAVAIEVKGIKHSRGGILFTDREWTEAAARRANYWLVVVGNVDSSPVARLITDPTATLNAKCQCQTTITASWSATVAVA
jgi:hypothetical protein